MVKDTSKEFEACLEVLDDGNDGTKTIDDFLGLTPEEKHDQNNWKTMWKGMPEFKSKNKQPVRKLIVSFETEEDFYKFGELIECNLTEKTRFIWWPEKEKYNLISKWFVDENDDELIDDNNT